MRALVVGAGAVGRYLAAQLKLAGHDAVLFARPGVAEELANGYALRIGDREQRVVVPVAATSADVEVREPFELAVTAVKAFSTPGAIESIRAIQACDQAAILVVQNGVGNEELCAAAFGVDRVVAGALTTAVEKTATDIAASNKGGLSIAPLGMPHNWLLAALEYTPIKVAAAPDWRALKWSKLCINLLGNAVCAILDWEPARVYQDPTSFSIERRCLRETIAVMDALKLEPVDLIDYPVRMLVSAARVLPAAVLRPILAARVAGARGGKLPSLLADTRMHRPQLEVDALNGAVAGHGKAAGVAVPANSNVTRILDAIAAGTIEWNEYRGKPAALAAAIDA